LEACCPCLQTSKHAPVDSCPTLTAPDHQLHNISDLSGSSVTCPRCEQPGTSDACTCIPSKCMFTASKSRQHLSWPCACLALYCHIVHSGVGSLDLRASSIDNMPASIQKQDIPPAAHCFAHRLLKHSHSRQPPSQSAACIKKHWSAGITGQ
jgi:hypothetical protein